MEENWVATYDCYLDEVRDKLGETPRLRSFEKHRKLLKPIKPEWDLEDDPELTLILENWERIFSGGILGWAVSVQANVSLFSMGSSNHLAQTLLWLDTDRFDPRVAMHIAQDIFSFKAHVDEIEDPELKKMAQSLADEYTRDFGVKVPKSVSHGIFLKMSTIYHQRHHLPCSTLTFLPYPVLFLPENPMLCMMVPFQFWPEEMVKDWESRCPEYQEYKEKSKHMKVFFGVFGGLVLGVPIIQKLLELLGP